MRVLFIARYRDATMERKLEWLARDPALTLRQIRPAKWRDPLLTVAHTAASRREWQQVNLAMWGRADDPHRALYRTVTFGLRRFRPDLIHAEEEPDSLSALQIAFARRLFAPRARLILHTWQNVERRRRPEVRWVRAQALRAADAVLCANSEARTLLDRLGYRGYTEVLPAIGVDTDLFQPGPPRPPSGRFVVGYVGRLAPEKGIETLLEAVALCGADVTARIIGGGPLRESLHAQAEALSLTDRVEFVAPAPPGEIALRMRELEALALPSRTTTVWKEQFGRALVEAMACAVPVIGSDSGAIPEVIGDAGLIFPEGDAPALAERIQRLQRSPELRRDLGERGRARAHTRYAQSVLAARTLAVYRRLLAERRAGGPER